MSEAAVPDETSGKKLRQATHRAIASVTEALEAFTFNVAVAKIHELANTIADSASAPLAARREAMEALIRLASPMMPHLAEEVWASFNPGAGLVAQLPWLEADPELLRAESVTLAVQVLGKLRGTIEVAVDASDEEVFALAESEPNVIRALDGKPVKKRIHVKGRVVNLVI